MAAEAAAVVVVFVVVLSLRIRHSDIDGLASFRNGEYKPVMNLIRTLKYGRQTKQEVSVPLPLLCFYHQR